MNSIASNNETKQSQLFDSWNISYTNSHILHSKCTETASEIGCEITDKSCCLFCRCTKEISLPHLPDMVFAKNILKLEHKSGSILEFNAIDALKRVQSGKMNLEIACSNEWKEARQETGLVEKVVGPFDWTFSTDYSGTLSGDWEVEECPEASIDWDRLKKQDKILFFHDLTLFEDELHDNGISVLSVKIRVMEWGYFILLRFFLRVDGVLLRINDTRYYHEFDADHVVKEFTNREAKYVELNVSPIELADQNTAVPLVPIRKTLKEKLIFKK